MEAVSEIGGVDSQMPYLQAPAARVPGRTPPQVGFRPWDEDEVTQGLRAEALSRETVRGLAETFGEAVAWVNRAVRYEVDELADRLVTKIIDRDTNEVVRQIPSEEALRVIRRWREFIGLLLDVET